MISTKDWLPPEIGDSLESANVLVKDDRGTFHIAHYDYDDNCWWSDVESNWYNPERIVAWQELPE